MSQPQNLDTTFTKIYVGGLPWTTRSEGLRSYFEQFGEIIHVNVVCDRATDRSQGYGFVTFKDAESATRACMDPKPTIDGRITNCKLASSGAKQSKQIRHDDLCFQAPGFWQNQQPLPYLHQNQQPLPYLHQNQQPLPYLHQNQQPLPYLHQQPLPPYTGQYWHHIYPQQSPQYNIYPQPYWVYNPQPYYPQYNQQYGPVFHQQYPMDHTNPMTEMYQPTNAANGVSSSLANTATLKELSPTPNSKSPSTTATSTTTDSTSDKNEQS